MLKSWLLTIFNLNIIPIFQEKSKVLALFKTFQKISSLVPFGLVSSHIFLNFPGNCRYIEKSHPSLEEMGRFTQFCLETQEEKSQYQRCLVISGNEKNSIVPKSWIGGWLEKPFKEYWLLWKTKLEKKKTHLKHSYTYSQAYY